MKRMLLILVVLAVSAQAQTFTEIFSGYAINGSTTNGSTTFALTGTSGNLFDSLKVLLQGGTENTLDSVRCAVYVQSYYFGRYSQGILVDSLVAQGKPDLRYKTASLAAMTLLVDSLKNRWFYGTSIAADAKNALFSQNGWLGRIYVVAAAYAPPLSSNATNGSRTVGGLVKVTRLKW